jgi:uncharacterized membrane protein YhhN
MLPWILVTLIALAALLIAEARNLRWLKWIAKPTASTGFLAVALTAGALDSSYGRVLFAALVFCWLGDVLLIPKDRRIFLAGLVAFLLGHVVLIGAFPLLGFDALGSAAALVPVAPAAFLALRWLAPHLSSGMRVPVQAYVAAISVMVLVAAGAALGGAGAVVLVCAVFFFVSDLAVARERFVASAFSNRAWGLPLYYGATLLLATTAAGV